MCGLHVKPCAVIWDGANVGFPFLKQLQTRKCRRLSGGECVPRVLQRLTVESSKPALRQEVRLHSCSTSSCGLQCPASRPASLWDNKCFISSLIINQEAFIDRIFLQKLTHLSPSWKKSRKHHCDFLIMIRFIILIIDRWIDVKLNIGCLKSFCTLTTK